VQVVGAVVNGQRVLHAVQGELALGDAVGIAAGHLAAAGTVPEIITGLLVADDHIGQLALLVRHHDGNDGGTHAAKLHVGTGGILKGVEEDFLPVGRCAPEFFGNGHISESFLQRYNLNQQEKRDSFRRLKGKSCFPNMIPIFVLIFFGIPSGVPKRVGSFCRLPYKCRLPT